MITANSDILAVIVGNIPAALRDAPRWVGWKGVPKPRKDGTTELTKEPRLIRSPRRNARTNHPKDWATFGDAAATAGVSSDLDGIGFVLCEGYVGVDLDNVVDPATGEISPTALDILRRLDTYCEISPSGTGVKAFLRGAIQKSGKGKADGIDVEIYGTEALTGARYFAVTGHRLDFAQPDVASLDAARLDEVGRLLAQLHDKSKSPRSTVA